MGELSQKIERFQQGDQSGGIFQAGYATCSYAPSFKDILHAGRIRATTVLNDHLETRSQIASVSNIALSAVIIKPGIN